MKKFFFKFRFKDINKQVRILGLLQVLIFSFFIKTPKSYADPSDESYIATLIGLGLFGATKFSHETENGDKRNLLTIRFPYQKMYPSYIPLFPIVVTPTYQYQIGPNARRHEISTGIFGLWSRGSKFSDVAGAKGNWYFLNYAYVIDQVTREKLHKFSPGFSINLGWFPLNFSYDHTKTSRGKREGYSVWMDFVLR